MIPDDPVKTYASCSSSLNRTTAGSTDEFTSKAHAELNTNPWRVTGATFTDENETEGVAPHWRLVFQEAVFTVQLHVDTAAVPESGTNSTTPITLVAEPKLAARPSVDENALVLLLYGATMGAVAVVVELAVPVLVPPPKPKWI